MIRAWFPMLFMFCLFFVLFWKIKHWKLSTAKKVGAVAICSATSVVTVGVVAYAFVVLFN